MKTVISIATLFVLLIFPLMVLAQPGFPGDPTAVPIDGGLTLLAVGGGAYAIKKIRDRHKV